MSQSVHVARWLSQLEGTGWDLHLFPSDWPCPVHSDIRNVTLHGVGRWRPKGVNDSVTVAGLWPFKRGAYRWDQLVNRCCPSALDRTRILVDTIRRVKPDIIHCIEMQHAGYLMLESRRKYRGVFPPIIYSCWGNDIYYFGKQPDHIERIKAFLRICDFFTADCYRDIGLARKFGFDGVDLGYFPGPGGFEIEKMGVFRETGVESDRRAIAVKGYDHWGGRARIALQAIHKCADLLSEYKIQVYSAPKHVSSVVEHMAAVTNLDIRVLPETTHENMLRLMGRSRISVGNSVSDGTPNSMLEAMVMGAFPVQSDTESTAEWIENGTNGFLVHPESRDDIERALRRALTDDDLVNAAARANADLTSRRIAVKVVRPRLLEAYNRVAGVDSRD